VVGMTSEKDYARSWIEDNREAIIGISDKIWEYAELGLVEYKSSSLLMNELERHGFRVERGVAGMPTAFIASYGRSRPIVAIMGEYDALPGLSQERVPYREPLEPGRPGHGCGHNIHGTSGMAAAIAVRYAMEKYGLKGTIRFYGCPAEENFSGKVFMVRDGCFRDVDAALSHHGRSAHAGGSPEQGRSALDAVELMNVGVNYLREHIIQDARIHYIIESGGEQPNIVPDYARSWYYIRAPEREQVEFIYGWILDIAEGAAKMTRTKVKHEFMGGLYNLIPNRTISEAVIRNMREIGLPEYTDEELDFAREIAKTIPKEMKIEALRRSKRPGWERLIDKLMDDEIPDPWGEGELSHGSTDVADVSWQAPTVEFNTASWVLGTPAHSWQAVAQSGVGLGHKSLIFASKVLASTALDLLMDDGLLKRAKEEHKRRLRGRVYKPPIPPEMRPPLDAWRSK